MRLTLRADYALRVLIFASLKGEALSTIPEIAAHFDISKGHVMKVVHELGKKRYLATVRGKNGGIRLARKPAQINIGAVVRDIEEDLAVVGCLQDRRKGFCRIETQCVLRGALRDATNAFLATLDRYALEDLAKPRRPLLHLLKLEGAA
jgi:Rrf2 family nitric oxide-sensitive transcriptional repressor